MEYHSWFYLTWFQTIYIPSRLQQKQQKCQAQERNLNKIFCLAALLILIFIFDE